MIVHCREKKQQESCFWHLQALCAWQATKPHLILGLRPFQVAVFPLSFLFPLAKGFMTPAAKWIMTKWVLFETLLSMYRNDGSFSDIYS